MNIYKKNKAFSIIEILVWIFVFSLWIASVYAIISSTFRINDYNKNYIIAVNLGREQLELIRNIRDSNYQKIQKYNQINPWISDYFNIFEYDKNYIIENNYSTTSNFPIKVEEIIDFWEWELELNWKMLSYRLCIDTENRYVYCSWLNTEIKTRFYKYINIKKVEYMESWIVKNIDDSFLVTSKIIWFKNWYHEFEVKSVIADWKRL